MTTAHRGWIPGIVFWVLFLGSLALGRRYWWVDAVWNVAWLLFLAAVAICAAVGIFRNRDKSGSYMGYRGVPRWAATLFGGEVDQQCEKAKTQPNTTMNG